MNSIYELFLKKMCNILIVIRSRANTGVMNTQYTQSDNVIKMIYFLILIIIATLIVDFTDKKLW